MMFVTACALNALVAAHGAFAIQGREITPTVFGFLAGTSATLVALVLCVFLMLRASSEAKQWIKATLVLLALGPIAFWTILLPAALNTSCIGRGCGRAIAEGYFDRFVADVAQGQFVIAIVSAAALVCALFGVTTPNRTAAA